MKFVNFDSMCYLPVGTMFTLSTFYGKIGVKEKTEFSLQGEPIGFRYTCINPEDNAVGMPFLKTEQDLMSFGHERSFIVYEADDIKLIKNLLGI